jgi:hypothetical protein
MRSALLDPLCVQNKPPCVQIGRASLSRPYEPDVHLSPLGCGTGGAKHARTLPLPDAFPRGADAGSAAGAGVRAGVDARAASAAAEPAARRQARATGACRPPFPPPPRKRGVRVRAANNPRGAGAGQACAKALEDMQSPLLELRAQLHLELSRGDVADDLYAAAVVQVRSRAPAPPWWFWRRFVVGGRAPALLPYS